MQASKALSAGMKRLRAKTKMSQAELAEVSGLSVQFIAALEQGRKEPSLGTLDALSTAFGVSVAELFVPDERVPKAGFATEVADLLATLSASERERVLAIVREVCALARPPKRGR